MCTGLMRVMSTSWPTPGCVVPALAFTTPLTLASLALPLLDEPTWMSPANPAPAHVVTLPATIVARESEGCGVGRRTGARRQADGETGDERDCTHRSDDACPEGCCLHGGEPSRSFLPRIE